MTNPSDPRDPTDASSKPSEHPQRSQPGPHCHSTSYSAGMGVLGGIGFIIATLVGMLAALRSGEFLLLMVAPVIAAALGFGVGMSGKRPGFTPAFLITIGVGLLILCGTCFAFFANAKI